MTIIKLESVLRCPSCGYRESLTMPTEACLFFHECSSCRTLLRPNAGDCCVFCSYGTVACPPIQEGSTDCCGTRPPNAAAP
ncbi:GDCCVxC domain-containing (seleno)protein [Gemmatimonas sp.]|uniref:GDCCVxC domain-containing (seleno)protein n=1 Tax=Gemmatimonas sp. TaxID=1962908 RepID=UPI00262C2C84|nr:GDCCVxC domain-containing (seleno)protein [Gemmatimonas sp.]